MARRKGKGKGKKTSKEPASNSKNANAEDMEGLVAGNDPSSEDSIKLKSSEESKEGNSSLKRKRSTITKPSTSDQENDTHPPVKRMRSRLSTDNKIKENRPIDNGIRQKSSSLSRSKSQENRPNQAKTQENHSTCELNNDKRAAQHVNKPSTSAQGSVKTPSLKRNDTVLIKPSTSAPTGCATKLASIRTGPSHSIATPLELMRMATLKRNESHPSITEPTSSDPETKALIAKSMELMRQASLRRAPTRSEGDGEDNQTEFPDKEKGVSIFKYVKTSSDKREASLSRANSESANHPGTSTGSSTIRYKQSIDSNAIIEAKETQAGSSTHKASNDVDVADTDDKFEDDFQMICDIHPDVDPVYIREQLQSVVKEPERVSTVTFDIYSQSGLPTKAEREEIEANQRRIRDLENAPFDLQRFFKKFPDPEEIFERGETGRKSKLYIENASTFLKNTFPTMAATHIYKVLRENRNYLTNTYDSLKIQHDEHIRKDKTPGRKKRDKKFIQSSREHIEYLDLDEDFCYEKHYILHRQQILEKANAEREAKEKRFQEAKRDGKLRECTVCFTPDLHEDDMLACPSNHLFCKECVRLTAEEQIGRGKATIACLENDCHENFQFYHMENTLPQQQSLLLLQRLQTEDIRQAEVENLVSCPFCPFAVVIPEEYTSTVSVLNCENPGCKKDTCLKCKEFAHVPFKCEEFRISRQARFKEFVEQRLADAIIRQCPTCHLRFFKEEGCNHMTCSSCGTSMCYVCRQQIAGYDHFRKNELCSAYVNPVTFHAAEVVEAYNALEEGFRETHPELGAMEVPDIYRPDELRQDTS